MPLAVLASYLEMTQVLLAGGVESMVLPTKLLEIHCEAILPFGMIRPFKEGTRVDQLVVSIVLGQCPEGEALADVLLVGRMDVVNEVQRLALSDRTKAQVRARSVQKLYRRADVLSRFHFITSHNRKTEKIG